MKAWGRVRDPLKWVSVACAIAVTATAEYDLAVAVGMHEAVAVAVPGALDAYVVRALQRNREVLTSVLAMVGVNAASHLEAAGVLAMDWRLITAVSAIAPLVLWRVHSLRDPGTWRTRKLWAVPDTSTAGYGGDEDEHGRAPDNPEPPGTREHPEHSTGTEDLDVPDWVNPPSTARTAVLKPVPRFEHTPDTASTPVLTLVPPPPPEYEPRSTTSTDTDTPTHDDLNLGHVAEGRITPADTAHMERARVLYARHGGGHGIVRAMKEAVSVGTDRAQRLVSACQHEHAAGHGPSTDTSTEEGMS